VTLVKETAFYRHARTGAVYTVLHLGQAKDGRGDWFAAVTYVRHITGEIFTRDLEGFAACFEEVMQ
jgi:hypothetical protein